MTYLSVVIPMYKAESCLHELYRRLKASIETMTEDFEMVMVEDCGGGVLTCPLLEHRTYHWK
jgi:dolichol-phosphate mannosyltransferase